MSKNKDDNIYESRDDQLLEAAVLFATFKSDEFAEFLAKKYPNLAQWYLDRGHTDD
jgi:hypothetical protein